MITLKDVFELAAKYKFHYFDGNNNFGDHEYQLAIRFSTGYNGRGKVFDINLIKVHKVKSVIIKIFNNELSIEVSATEHKVKTLQDIENIISKIE